MSNKIISTNRKIFRDYQILETYEAGIVLKGSEVKSLRNSNTSLQDSYCKIENNELLLYNMYIAPYKQSGVFSPAPRRIRKLLLHRNEINRLYGKLTQGNLVLIPVELYFNNKGIAKLKLGLAKRLKGPDKRDQIKKRELDRELKKKFPGII